MANVFKSRLASCHAMTWAATRTRTVDGMLPSSLGTDQVGDAEKLGIHSNTV